MRGNMEAKLINVILLPALYFIIRQILAKSDEQMTKYTLVGLVYVGVLMLISIIIFFT